MEEILLSILIICFAFIFFRVNITPESKGLDGNIAVKTSTKDDEPQTPLVDLNSNKVSTNSTESKTIHPITILYATQTGTSKQLSNKLAKQFRRSKLKVELTIASLDSYSVYDLENEKYVIVIIPTWTGGTHVTSAKVFAEALSDAAVDFRVGKHFLNNVKFSIFGLGNSEYDEDFCKAAKDILKDFESLGADVIHPLGLGDDNLDIMKAFSEWSSELINIICSEEGVENHSTLHGKASSQNQATKDRNQDPSNKLSLREHRRQKRQNKLEESKRETENGDDTMSAADIAVEDQINARLLAEADEGFEEEVDAGVEEEVDGEEGYADDALDEASGAMSKLRAERVMETEGDDEAGNSGDSNLVDMEDLGVVINSSKDATVKANDGVVRDMVTPAQRRALTKEGYKIIGTHSAVKLCRWTKNQLRGRGGCYKHTFYGIKSYQCMEATPSLACANKCVFCWRHHKNPVGREWRWTTDDPERIVSEAIEKHQTMIKATKGIPGVMMDRYNEAFEVRHCALSLVGEPIMYPHINKFLSLLHSRDISSFLVTNAQFPKAIKDLDPCTQLYVSVDGATKQSLKAVDRPLFKDFWERFIDSLKALKDKKQRTVYRMTLVKSWNMEEAANYVQIIQHGEPDFIEIKAVTYCGKSDGSSLTMENVPWHEEVRNYATHICDAMGGDYGIAAEHRHSCCMLLAKMKFKIEGVWNTWIDYERYHELIKVYYESGKAFSAEDYMAPTPYWALHGAKEEGFSPFEKRWKRKIGIIEDSGCG